MTLNGTFNKGNKMTNVEKINKVLPWNESYISESKVNQILDSDYNLQVVDFLLKTETTCKIEYIGLDTPKWGKEKVFTYSVTLKNKKHIYTFKFYDSINNTNKNKKATYDFYSVLACLSTYIPDSFDDFCSDFGYEFKTEEDCIDGKQTHLACLYQQRNLKKLFTDEELILLAEIS